MGHRQESHSGMNHRMERCGGTDCTSNMHHMDNTVRGRCETQTRHTSSPMHHVQQDVREVQRSSRGESTHSSGTSCHGQSRDMACMGQRRHQQARGESANKCIRGGGSQTFPIKIVAAIISRHSNGHVGPTDDASCRYSRGLHTSAHTSKAHVSSSGGIYPGATRKSTMLR